MKIVVISPNSQHLQGIRQALESGAHTVRLFDGGKSRMREIADEERPDLMLVDGICRDAGELANVEQVGASHPGLAVLLMCASHTPEFLIAAMRAGVREVLPSPVPDEALRAAVERVAAKLRGTQPNAGRILAFMAAKGGSGATFLATNLAWHLAENASVLLLDLNLQFGDALSFVHDGRPASTIADVAKDISRLDASLLSSSTVKLTPRLALLAAPEDLSQAAEVRPDHVEAILKVAAANHDFVVVDLPRSLDPMTIAVLDRAARIYGVLQSALPDLRNATRLLQTYRALGYTDDKLEMIVNRYEKTGDIGLEQIRRSLGNTRLTTVPNAWRDVAASINHGDPLARTARGGHVARQLAELARSLSPRQDDDNRGLLGRLFRRA